MGEVVTFSKKQPDTEPVEIVEFTIQDEDREFWNQFVSFCIFSHTLILTEMEPNSNGDDHYTAKMIRAFLHTLTSIEQILEHFDTGNVTIGLESHEVAIVMMGLIHFTSVGQLMGEFSAKQYERKCAAYVDHLGQTSKFFFKQTYYIQEFQQYVQNLD